MVQGFSMDEFTKYHLDRLRSATTHRYSRADICRWVCENTFMNGRKFSVKGHEFQERIMNDPSQEIVIIKSAQLGISEMAMRMSLAMVMTMPDSFSIGYTFPTATFAAQYSKTRLSPIISSSPVLRNAIRTEDIDSAEARGFGEGRYLYFKGAAVGNSAISTSLDMLVHDEVSFSDPTILGDYHSRLIHSPHKIKVKLSTPTWPGDLIDTAFKASRRWMNFCKCVHCNEIFYPSYYDHVKIPGFDKHLDEVTEENLHTLDYHSANLLCPGCGKTANLQHENRFWVCENPGDNYVATGYRVSPFDAPNVITVPYLIEASTAYANKAKFRQFNLGQPSIDAESGLTDEDIEAVGVESSSSPFSTHVMGIDLGLICHFMIGGTGTDNKLGVVYAERVPLAKFRERYAALKSEYRITVVVSDMQPYTDLIMSLSAVDANLWAASYVGRSSMELFDIKVQQADTAEAMGDLRQVSVNRNAIFDRVMVDVRESRIWIRKQAETWETLKEHLQDMKRASQVLRNGEVTSVWQKSSSGKDHFHHALAYLVVASQLRGVTSGASIPLLPVHKFKQTSALSPEELRKKANEDYAAMRYRAMRQGR